MKNLEIFDNSILNRASQNVLDKLQIKNAQDWYNTLGGSYPNVVLTDENVNYSSLDFYWDLTFEIETSGTQLIYYCYKDIMQYEYWLQYILDPRNTELQQVLVNDVDITNQLEENTYTDQWDSEITEYSYNFPKSGTYNVKLKIKDVRLISEMGFNNVPVTRCIPAKTARSIPNGLFRTSKLEYIYIPKYVSFIGQYAFPIDSTHFPTIEWEDSNVPLTFTVQALSSKNYRKMTTFTFPERTTEILHQCFQKTDLEYLVIPKNVTLLADISSKVIEQTVIGSIATEYKIDTVICLPTTPPKAPKHSTRDVFAIYSSVKPNVIYVPDESVELYKITDGYSKYPDIIKPLSECTIDY